MVLARRHRHGIFWIWWLITSLIFSSPGVLTKKLVGFLIPHAFLHSFIGAPKVVIWPTASWHRWYVGLDHKDPSVTGHCCGWTGWFHQHHLCLWWTSGTPPCGNSLVDENSQPAGLRWNVKTCCHAVLGFPFGEYKQCSMFSYFYCLG